MLNAFAEVASFRPKKRIENELNSVDLRKMLLVHLILKTEEFELYDGQNPRSIDGSLRYATKPKMKGDTGTLRVIINVHISSSIFPEKGLCNNGSTNSSGRLMKEGYNRPANSH
jgi:hypothetical protein